MLIGTFLVRGLGFAYPFLPYHLAGLGFSTRTIGWVVAAFGGGWLIGQAATGWLADRIGHRTTLVAAMAVAAAVLPSLAQLRGLAPICAAAVLAGMVYDAGRPVVSAVIAEAVPTQAGQALVNGWRHYAVNCAAGAAGALGGHLAISLGTEALFWINAGACAAFGVAALRYLPSRPRRCDTQPGTGTGYAQALRDRRLWLLSLASLCALICAGGIFTALPILMTSDQLDASAYGTTQVTNAAVVLVLSPLLTPWLSRQAAAAAPMTALLAVSGAILGVAMGVAGLADSTLGYSIAAALAVPGEVILFIAAGAIVTRIAPPQSRGLYAGLWGTNMATAIIIAPLATAWALEWGGGPTAAAVSVGTGLLCALLCWPLHRSLRGPGSEPARV
ncbi:MFS transporter [Streptomyces globisporus]|uniref:MFS transporter n=1 Tax=Streptomyces globisporus TaxID=1908 RepID=UPI0036DEED17